MTKGRDPIRILELRSVRGTGGGPEKTILLGAAGADVERFAVTVCYVRDARDAVFGIGARASALAVDYVEVRERHSFDRSIWPALVSIVRRRQIDIVHAHDYKTDFLALALARATGAIALSTVHGWIHDSWKERRIYYPADKWMLRRFPRVIAVSGVIRDTLIESGVEASRITTLLNGIDPAKFRREQRDVAAARRELGIEPSEIAIGTVGRLEPVKRFDVLLDAVARLQKNCRVAKLFIVGDGSLRETLIARATELGVEGCRLLGHRADVVRLHHAFDVFVQSSDSEGTPNAVLEAMALETPVVATDAGGTRDIVAHDVHGLIVPCGDAAALARAIERTMTDRRATLARVAAARARIERELSFERRTRDLEAIYEQLVAKREDKPELTCLST
ncbi:MAG TPA: glycosyltransferase [Vicinamibacterales bacterium]|jgi:glycosyltransferase involved in cell wall biosynthesis|nr:glycosyltransferase [Vicinamibacterales bacterium]